MRINTSKCNEPMKVSMWKPGQLVTLNGKVYRIHKTQYTSGYRQCMFCQQCNMKPPCINMFDYPNNKTSFGLTACRIKMPNCCIPKRIQYVESWATNYCKR